MAIRCPNCGNENPDDYAFCDECGARLTPTADAGATTMGEGTTQAMGGTADVAGGAPVAAAGAPATGGLVRCPNCGAENVAGAAFCDECGAALPEMAAAAPATADTVVTSTTITTPAPAYDASVPTMPD